jgi:hypothetical protein
MIALEFGGGERGMREVIYCPGCQKRLQLPEGAIGRSVQCPGCGREFTATGSMGNPPVSADAPKPNSNAPTPPPSRRYDSNDDLDLDRGRRKRRRKFEDDDDYDDRRRDRRSVAGHRGGEILTFGLLALLPCCFTSIIFGIIAWIMANTDLEEMRSGRMDRDGEGLTHAGRALGITGLFLICGASACFFFLTIGR